MCIFVLVQYDGDWEGGGYGSIATAAQQASSRAKSQDHSGLE